MGADEPHGCPGERRGRSETLKMPGNNPGHGEQAASSVIGKGFQAGDERWI